MAKKKVAPKSRNTKKSTPKTKSGAPSLAELEKGWQESREKAPTRGGAFGANPNVPDGDYTLHVQSAKVGQYKSGRKKGGWYFSMRYVVADGECSGEVLNTMDEISDRVAFTRDDGTEVTCMDLLSERLQNCGLDISELKLTELPELAQALSDPKSEIGRPFVAATVQNKYSPKKPTDPDPETPWHNQNIFLNGEVDAPE